MLAFTRSFTEKPYNCVSIGCLLCCPQYRLNNLQTIDLLSHCLLGQSSLDLLVNVEGVACSSRVNKQFLISQPEGPGYCLVVYDLTLGKSFALTVTQFGHRASIAMPMQTVCRRVRLTYSLHRLYDWGLMPRLLLTSQKFVWISSFCSF